MRDVRKFLTTALGAESCSLKMDSTTEISVDVVSSPQKAAQSLATSPDMV